jgi:hypothetical protein
LCRYAAAQLAKTGGQIEEFVNPKYKDDTKTAFKSPTRLVGGCVQVEFSVTQRA